MVNKQYTIHHSSHQHYHHTNGKIYPSNERYSPPSFRNPSAISEIPNPSNRNFCTSSLKSFKPNENHSKKTRKRAENIYDSEKSNSSTDTHTSISTTARNENNFRGISEHNDLFANKLTINDIGRFQYILQMDKEMNSHSDAFHHIQSRISNSSNNETDNIEYWKASSDSQTTQSQNICHNTWKKIETNFRNNWKYIKWLLFCVICCIFCGFLLFFLVLNEKDINDNNFLYIKKNSTELKNGTQNAHEYLNKSQAEMNNHILSVYMKNPKSPIDNEENTTVVTVNTRKNEDLNNNRLNRTSWQTTTVATTTTTSEEKYDSSKEKNLHNIEESKPESTTQSFPLRNTQILRIRNKSKVDDYEEFTTTKQMIKDEKTQINPTKDSVQIIGFTSGHQNNFGVPIEEDERVLEILNSELNKQKLDQIENTTNQFVTTDSSAFIIKVSPTLPAAMIGNSTIENSSEMAVTTDVEMCESTSLKICRGILQYDLTTLKRKRHYTPIENEHFKYLFESKCSLRAAEFVCSALEPECRPSKMGILQPCKRICKTILEPCASIIASSEILTAIFDCDQYPDSNDANVCEDPTRRGRCYHNEFKCSDSSCIPMQWRCDNIKDCSFGEDEEDCLLCEQEEFRCLSNDKCIPVKWKCDEYDDCPDKSDEMNCDHDSKEESYTSQSDDDDPIFRSFAFSSIQLPDESRNDSFINVNDENKTANNETDTKTLSLSENIGFFKDIESLEVSNTDDDEIQGQASGRVVTIPKPLANFQDSKEIMMTSDSENDFKYSKINRTVRSSTTTSTTTTEKTDITTFKANLYCPENQLRCVSGKCITVSQICDKTIDCSDGADEAMCVYKDE